MTTHAENGTATKIIAADFPLLTSRYPLESLLNAFKALCAERANIRLVLAGARRPEEDYSVWNFVDANDLAGRVDFLPYYDRCDQFPIKKSECDVWISRTTPADQLTIDLLRRSLDGEMESPPKYALFFTSFHPQKQEGNSRLMRIWLDHLRDAGYRVHLVYYMYDLSAVTSEMRREALKSYNLYLEVDVESRLVGKNRNGLNVHVDDWCGVEALDAVSELVSRFEYDLAITNYPFMTAVFDRVQAYTQKILLTHDSFADRNRRMLAQGYEESGWMSLDEQGERLACERSDAIVALQEEEAEHFRRLADDACKVVVVSPLFPQRTIVPRQPEGRLRIGYFGSSNWINEKNIGEYMRLWADDAQLAARSEIFIAGGVCENLEDFVPIALLSKVEPRLLGRVQDLGEFFSQCDVIINPERGGTGIKIKTLEALSYGVPVMTTRAASVGIGSKSRFHNARDIADLVRLSSELAAAPKMLTELHRETEAAFSKYCDDHSGRLATLLGPVRPVEHTSSNPTPPKRPYRPPDDIRVPDYVKDHAAGYHLDEFRRFIERVDIRYKRILEIGSDYHLISSRLFKANGAREVFATNIGDWRSEEPLPDGVIFKVGDVADLEVPADSFDIIYGIAILEHIPDLARVCEAIKKLLRPDGVAYLQGCPLWPGALGHHVWYEPNKTKDFEKVFATGGGKKSQPVSYSFADRKTNPIPDWAHLALTAEQLASDLVRCGIPAAHATGMTRYIFNLDGTMAGSCSNFMAASEILRILNEHFDVTFERILSEEPQNEYFVKAREAYSEEDLRTLGLQVWLFQKNYAREAAGASIDPKISLIIPFYNVEQYFEACLNSVVNQDYSNLEILLIDDASPDGSRQVAERFAGKDSRIKLITHDDNRGLGPARNTGVMHATGSYLLFLDSDDFFSSRHAVSTLVGEAESSGCKIVIGSCERLSPEGVRSEFDRVFDKSHGGLPGEIIDGEAAYLGASFIPGGRYVPMRAWGTLIDQALYLESGLDFPGAEHEDLAHTPFLYYFAGRVLYIPDIVVTYRQRPSSISNARWDARMIRRYANMWREMIGNIERFDLQAHRGDTALKTAEHLIMKLRQNGLEHGAEDAAIDVLAGIMAEAKGELNEALFFHTMDSLQAILDFRKDDAELFHKLTGGIDQGRMIRYYRNRLAGNFIDYGSIKLTPQQELAPTAVSQPPAADGATRTRNDALLEGILDEYAAGPKDKLEGIPSMLSTFDRALCYHAGKHLHFRGSIVDSGCFLGGTTASLALGLMNNPSKFRHEDAANGLIRVYDLFFAHDRRVLEHLRRDYPDRRFAMASSFLDRFRENLAEHAGLLDVRRGDITGTGYPDSEPIEVLCLDLCENLAVTDYMVRNFYTRLLPQALVIHRGVLQELRPYVQLTMLRLQDCFEKFVESDNGGTVGYKCVRPITPETVTERFGTDSSWYQEVEENASLLQEMEGQMVYEANRRAILQTLGAYFNVSGLPDRANSVYEAVKRRFPGSHTPDNVSMLRES